MASEIRTIYWSDAGQQGNKRLQKLHPNMLKPQGYKALRERTLSGEKHLKNVHYDMHYVVAKIVADILEPLGMDIGDFIRWLEENSLLIYAHQTKLRELNADTEESEDSPTLPSEIYLEGDNGL